MTRDAGNRRPARRHFETVAENPATPPLPGWPAMSLSNSVFMLELILESKATTIGSG